MIDNWKKIAKQYAVERESASFNSILLDKLVCELAIENHGSGSLLDFGAGIGTMSKLLADSYSSITAVEPSEDMRRYLEEDLACYQHITIVPNLDFKERNKYNVILCLNVLDHVEEFDEILVFFYDALKERGTLILSLPHPLKDLGDWEKEYTNEEWDYLFYRLEGYLTDQKCSKTREDVSGNVIVEEVVSFHRAISTYYNALIESGFTIRKMYEPTPDIEYKIKQPILYTKSSRIPYFWLLVCKKEVF